MMKNCELGKSMASMYTSYQLLVALIGDLITF